MGRIERVDAELIKELTTLINYELKDPRIDTMITVMRVETTKDLKNAKVYVSAMSSGDTVALLKALKSASSHLRSELFHRLKIRAVPELQFILDDSIEYGFKINKLLDQIAVKDVESTIDGEDKS